MKNNIQELLKKNAEVDKAMSLISFISLEIANNLKDKERLRILYDQADLLHKTAVHDLRLFMNNIVL